MLYPVFQLPFPKHDVLRKVVSVSWPSGQSGAALF
jgi:hypothetical protein